MRVLYLALFLLSTYWLHAQADVAMSLIAWRGSMQGDLFSEPLKKSYPECDVPGRAHLLLMDDHKAMVRLEEAIDAQGDFKIEIAYEVRANGQLLHGGSAFIENGNTYLIAESFSFAEYNVKIRRHCRYPDSDIWIQSAWVSLSVASSLRSDWSEFDCDQFNGGSANFNIETNEWLINPGLQLIDYTGFKARIRYNLCSSPNVDYYKLYAPINSSGFILDEDSLPGAVCKIAVTILWPQDSSGIVLDSCDYYTIYQDYSVSCDTTHVGGGPYDPTSLHTLNVKDVFLINGFPVSVASITAASGGRFKGLGLIQLPFTNQTVEVNFDVSLNINLRATGGSVTTVSDTSVNLGGNLVLGAPICQKSMSEWDENGNHIATGQPWDPRGFGQNGKYGKVPPYDGYEEGDPFDEDYDPCGFDANGIHAVTETNVNEDGCPAVGVKDDGTQCDPCGGRPPYYWLDQGGNPPSGEGIAFSHEIKDSIIPILTRYLDFLQEDNQDSITAYSSALTSLRSQILTRVSNASLDPDFLFGESNEYINEGMNQKFIRRPQPYAVSDYTRDTAITQIENVHIQIYERDLLLGVFRKRDTIFTQELLSLELDTSRDEMLYFIRRLDSATVASFRTDTAAFASWLRERMDGKLTRLFEGSYSAGPFEPEPESLTGGGAGSKKASGKGGVLSPGHDKPGQQRGRGMPGADGQEMRPHEIAVSGDKESSELFAGLMKKASSPEADAFDPFADQRSYTDDEIHAFSLESILHERQLSAGSRGLGFRAPIALTKAIMGVTYTIMLDSIIITPTSALLDAYAIIHDQASGSRIVFVGKGIGFGSNGFLTKEVRVELASDIELRLLNTASIKIRGGSNTYVAFDCEGYKSCGIEGTIEFCPNYLVPVDTVTMQPDLSDTARVRAHVLTTMQQWGDFMVGVSLDPFMIVDAPGFVWQVKDAFLDMSDTESPPVKFPSIYNSPFVSNGIPSVFWKGFYLRELSVKMKNTFTSDDGPLKISLVNTVIDDMGFTGMLGAYGEILELSKGKIGGWACSVDTIEIGFVANRLSSGEISGLLHVPLFQADTTETTPGPEDCFRYGAFFQEDGSIEFLVAPGANYVVPIWKADVTIDSRSYVKAWIGNEEGFRIEAHLTGMLTIDGSFGGGVLEVPDIAFERVIIRNHYPYVDPGTWKVPSGGVGVTIAGLSLSVTNIKLNPADSGRIVLHFDTGIGLSESDLSISASGSFRLIGQMQEVSGRQRYVYNDFKMDGFSVNATIKDVMKLYGEILFFEDNPTYGRGFRGVIDVTLYLPKEGNTRMAAMALFGKKNDLRYFFVDMLFVSSTVGIPLGLAKINGFGGGAYYHMSRDTTPYALPASYAGPGELSSYSIGQSLSGINYLPDAGTLFGFQATVFLVSEGSSKAFNANVSLEMSFYAANPVSGTGLGGLKEVVLRGSANFMNFPELTATPAVGDVSNMNLPAPNNGKVSAYIEIDLDFQNKVFQGDLSVYLSAGLLHGSGANNRMGWAKVYFSEKDWYIHIGTPTNRLGLALSLKVGSVNLGMALTAYFAIGTQVPDIPPLPARFKAFEAQANSQNKLRSSGKGFAFGSSFELTTGELSFLVFFAKFSMGLGFDVMVKDYGETECINTGEQIGINGWYATGQIWAYVDGDIGIKWKSKRYKIIGVSGAVAMQAQLPNPFYARGIIEGKYNILFGLVKGTCRFNFEIGERCQVAGGQSVQDSLEVVLSTFPDNGSEEVPTETIISIDLAVALDREFRDGDGQHYLVKMKTLKVFMGNYEIGGRNQVSEDRTFVEFRPDHFLPGDSELKLMFKFEVIKNGALFNTVIDTITFTTAGLPSRIMPENVLASYPLDGQLNYYRMEKKDEKGYIMFERSQAYLFTSSGKQKAPAMRLIKPNGQYHFLPYEFANSAREIVFDLPAMLLDSGQFYKIQVYRPGGDKHKIDYPNPGRVQATFPEVTRESSYDYPPYDYVYGTESSEEEILYEMEFRVSLYPTVKAKFDYMFANGGLNKRAEILSYTTPDMEPFDQFETDTVNGRDRLFDLTAEIQHNQLRYCSYHCWPDRIFSAVPEHFYLGECTGLDGNFYVDLPDCEGGACALFRTKAVYLSGGGASLSGGSMRDRMLTQNFTGIRNALIYGGVNKIRDQMNKAYFAYTSLESQCPGDGSTAFGSITVSGPLVTFLRDEYDPVKPLFLPGQEFATILVSYLLPGKNRETSRFRVKIE